jgi:hypothetical protein
MITQPRSRMFIISLLAVVSMLAITIYYFAPMAIEALNLASIDKQQLDDSAVGSGSVNEMEIITSQSQVEAAQLSHPTANQSLLPDLAPTLVGSSANVSLLPDLAPTLVKSPRDTGRLPDLEPTFTNPSLGVYRYSDMAPTLVQDREESPEPLPDLAPTIVQSQETIDRSPDLEPTLP